MQAYKLYGIGDIHKEETSIPECPPGWAIVNVKACGICSSDIPRIFKKGTYHFPTIPGHELSGIVKYVNSAEHKNLIGMHVGVFPLIPCRKCPQCNQKKYEMCTNYDYIGSRRDGGFAEYVAVPIWNLITIPKEIPFELSAMLEPLAVAFHAIKIAHPTAASKIGIIGNGAIGIAAGIIAKHITGANVTIVGRSENKKNLVTKLNLKHSIIDNTENIEDFDIVIEAVGSQSAIINSIDFTKRGGELVLMGNPVGDINLPQNYYWQILRKQLTIKGTWNSSYDGLNESDWTKAVDLMFDLKSELLSLITHRFSANNLMDALTMMIKKQEPYCKVMTLWDETF